MIFNILINANLKTLIPDFELEPIENKKVLSIFNNFQNGKWYIEQFHNYIWDNISQSALNSEERKAHIDQPQTTLINAAKNLRLTDSSNATGEGSELAEILLYAIMKDHFHALPVVPKIFYKQNINDNAKGADSVHIVIEDQKNKIFSLWIGEAKFYNSINNERLTKIVNSIASLLDSNKLKKECSIISGLTDLNNLVEDKQLLKDIKEKLNQNTSLDDIKPILHVPILLLYECPLTKKATEISHEYKENMKKQQTDTAKRYFSKQIKTLANTIWAYDSIKFHFILFPVPDKNKITDKFIKNVQFFKEEE